MEQKIDNKNKKSNFVTNVLIQVFGYVAAGILTYFVAKFCLVGICQPWKSILSGVVFVVIVFLILIVTNIIKATKDPDVQAASNLRITVTQYREFKTLFDMIIQDEMMNDERIRELLYKVMLNNPSKWKSYCLSREKDYKPLYSIGKEMYVRNENNKYIKGIITDIEFRIEWWYYTIEFTEPISINNNWPSEKQFFLAREIMYIETNDPICDPCHYVF